MNALAHTRRRGPNAALLAWFSENGRELAFRQTADPWAVLVSEVMLQQTQAVRVDAAWRLFLDRFPTPGAMASAPVGDVIRAWAGLGYNRRAVALHRTARLIVERHGGVVPDDVGALERLPGVGPYTARAVAAIGFGRATAAIDTNVRRVVMRLTQGIERDEASDGSSGVGPGPLQALADGLVARDRPAAWTHAMMDLGALLCRPRAPACARCPISRWCRFAAERTPAATQRRWTVSVARKAGGSIGSRGQRFTATDRWLRGRIVQRLRDAERGTWTRVDGPLGEHSAPRVDAAVLALERDGLLERRPDGALRLPFGAT